MFTGSFDGTLKIWDVSDLEAEKAGGSDDKKKKKNQPEYEDDDDEDLPQQNDENRDREP